MSAVGARLVRLENRVQHRGLVGTQRPHQSRIARAASSAVAGSWHQQQQPLLQFDALTVDVGGTLLQTAQPVPETYAAIGKKYGVVTTPEEIRRGFKEAFSRPWRERLRYVDDGRPFWRFAVELATGSSDQDYFEELYAHYARGAAWTISERALEELQAIRGRGVKLGIVSNFDSRLRPILTELGVVDCFDAVIVSSETGFEKPAVEIFRAAMIALQAEDPKRVVHVGDDITADVEGAQAAGMTAWLWKVDVTSFADVRKRVLSGQ